MTRLKWDKPRGRGVGGSTSVQARFAKATAYQARLELAQLNDYRPGSSAKYAMKHLEELARAGDEHARFRLLKLKAAMDKGRQNGRKTMDKQAAERNKDAVPKGHRRIKRRDPKTGEWLVFDLPIPPHVFDHIMLGVQRGIARCDLAYLEPWQWQFLLYGRKPTEGEA